MSPSRSRPETPHTGNTPGNSIPATPKLSRATTPQRSISQQSSHVIESTTPLTPGEPEPGKPTANQPLPILGEGASEKVKDNTSTGGALPGITSQQAGSRRGPALEPRYEGGEVARYTGPDLANGRMTPSSDSSQSIGNLSIPNAGYILGNRLYEQRQSFQNVMGSNPDLTIQPQDNDFRSQQRRGSGPPLALAGPASQPPPLDSNMVKTLNNFSSTSILQPIPTTSFVPVVKDGKSEPSIPYKALPPTSTRSTRSHYEYQIESTVGVRSEFSHTTPYMGPSSERSAKVRPISAGSGKSEGLYMEHEPDDADGASSLLDYEITIPETDPGNEEPHHVTDEKDSEAVGEKEDREFVEEECEEDLCRDAEQEHEDQLDEVMRPQAGDQEEPEYEDYVMEDGRNSAEIEGEEELELQDHTPETVDDMENRADAPAVGDEVDGEVEDLVRAPEEEDEEPFERGATPNSHTTEYLRDDISSTSLVRTDSLNYVDAVLDPELNALTLTSGGYNDDDECGELTLKEVIRDAFDTPYLRDYAQTPTGETDSEPETEYEFCNESEDDISVAQQHSDVDDDGN